MADQDQAGEGRRQRARRATLAELDAAAAAEVREHGAVQLSLRRVARRMGMSPAGLYRYVDSREALLTRLIARAYDDLADHLEAATGRRDLAGGTAWPRDLPVAADADVADRARAAALGYRHWAVTSPQAFGLLFGDPIPGYEAPAGGVTVDAMGRVGSALGRPLVDAWSQGRLRPVVAPEAVRELAGPLAPMAAVADRPVPPEVGLTLLLAWGRLHGQVSLEVFGHHRWLFPDGCEVMYRADVEAMLRELGVDEGR